jgi:DNA-binding MurR/RpiR family transcriptional regulator
LGVAGRLFAGLASQTGRTRVRILSGGSALGAAVVLASGLSTLCADVELADADDRRWLGALDQAVPDVLVVFDATPHDARLFDAVSHAIGRGVGTIGITDETSPLAGSVPIPFAAPTTRGDGRTTYVGMVALVNALINETTAQITAHV